MSYLSLFVRYEHGLSWSIRAMRLIRGTVDPPINHEARIHHARRRVPPDRRDWHVTAGPKRHRGDYCYLTDLSPAVGANGHDVGIGELAQPLPAELAAVLTRRHGLPRF